MGEGIPDLDVIVCSGREMSLAGINGPGDSSYILFPLSPEVERT